MLEVLRQGSEGPNVLRWQRFLLGQGLLPRGVDGIFGPFTRDATVGFQRRARVEADGVVGPQTVAAALRAGFDPGFSDPLGGTAGLDWPPPPIFAPLVSNAERARVFGRFRYEPKGPATDDIRILDDWEATNIRTITVPQLQGVAGAPSSGRIRMHRLIVEQAQGLFEAWEEAGLLAQVRTWAGSFVPRFIRGRRDTLSSHAWGTAFDINAEWNGLGHLPALRGRPGSVRELVPLANQFGFFWGGHFRGRADGMHFEAARVLG